MFPPEVPSRRLCPRHQVIVVKPNPVELDLSLVPLDTHGFEPIAMYASGFQPRIRPVTQQELADMDRVRGVKSFGVFVGGAGVVWHRSEEEAKAQAARLESMGFDVIVAMHPAIAKATGSAS